MEKVRTKVLFVIENLMGGGAERVFVNLLNNVDKCLFEPVLVVVNSGNGANKYNPPEGVQLINLQTRKTRALFPLMRVIRHERPDIVFSNLAPINVLCLMAKLLLRDFRTKYIARETTIKSISIKETKANPLVRLVYGQLVRFFYPFADCIVALSNGSKDDLVTNFGIDGEKIVVIHNPIDVKEVIHKSMEMIEDADAWKRHFNVICVGSLVKSKGHIYLLEAMNELVNKRGYDIKLRLIGTGPLRKELGEVAKRYHLEKHVEFLGFQTNPFKYMRNGDVFVLPALWEGFGNVIVEAMACGIPVISTLCESGPREIIEHSKTGILVEPKNVSQIVEAIQLIKDNDNLADQLRSNALHRATDFDVSLITRQYEKHFLDTLSRV